MWIAFLSALVDPLVVGTALIGVLLVRSAMQLRLIVGGLAAALSLSELIGGLQDPWTHVLANAVGAAAGGLLIAESARFIVAPIAAGFVALVIFTVCSLKNRSKQKETGAAKPPSLDDRI
jgi:hypothetical protein